MRKVEIVEDPRSQRCWVAVDVKSIVQLGCDAPQRRCVGPQRFNRARNVGSPLAGTIRDSLRRVAICPKPNSPLSPCSSAFRLPYLGPEYQRSRAPVNEVRSPF
jgi:hypothetical protein